MNYRFFIVIISGILLAGCATAKAPSASHRLEQKYISLEKKMMLKDRAIEDLKYQVGQLSARIERMSSPEQIQPMETYVDMDESEIVTKTGGSSENKEGIIRVGTNVQSVQKALKNAGYYNGSIDGKIGSKSKKAIRTFQKDHDLKVDGIVGHNTWKELKLYLESE